MVTKRIISCLAMLSVVFFVSCYDVQYNTDETNAGDWFDGLTTKQIVEGMEIKAEAVDSTDSVSSKDTTDTTQTDIEVSWIFPEKMVNTNWAMKYKIISIDGSEDVDWTDGGDAVVLNKDYWQGDYGHWEGHWFWRHWVHKYQYIIFYKISMTDTNGETYENIVSFMVTPNGRTLRITYTGSESNVNSIIYGGWLDVNESLFSIVKTAGTSIAASAPGAYREFATSANLNVYFWIVSDFSSKGFGTVTHYSNSSYCKVTRISPRYIPGRTVEASLVYTFEDLPQDMLKHEDEAAFDYDDVTFYVDIIR